MSSEIAASKILTLPTVEYLRECFRYDEPTDKLFWLLRPLSHFPADRDRRCWITRFAGREAGSTDMRGYRMVSLLGRRWYVHRIVWKLVTGHEPPPELDHRTGCRSDANPAMLRPATHAQNMANRPKQSNNTTGLKGVTRHGTSYRARIKVSGKLITVGRFKTKEEAYECYCKLGAEHLGEFWHPG